MLEVRATARFKKDLKAITLRGYDAERLWDAVSMPRNGIVLPERMRDHALAGDYIGFRECHLLPDWLLVYRVEESVLLLTLVRTGTHGDLF